MVSKNANVTLWQIPQNPEKLEINEITSFKKNFVKKNVNLERIGTFDTVAFEKISIIPDSQESAERWTEILFAQKISGYLTENEFNDEWKEIVRVNTELEQFNIQVPEIERILKNLTFGTKAFWFIQAPKDLKLEELI